MASALPGILAKKVAVVAPPPPPVVARVWNTVTDGDGIVQFQGDATNIYIRGTNDGGGNGWAYVYSYFTTPGSLTFSYDYQTNDGPSWDWAFYYTQRNEPVFGQTFFGNKFVVSNTYGGSFTINYNANEYVVIGVYSVDSVAGPGNLWIRNLPLV
jgi:hypothetical protein